MKNQVSVTLFSTNGNDNGLEEHEESMTHPEQPFEIRLATVHDAATIAGHRSQIFHDLGTATDEIMAPLIDASTAYFARTIASGEYVGWLACEPHAPTCVVAGAGIHIRQTPPFPTVDAAGNRRVAMGKQGFVLNVYVDPRLRRQGIARRLMAEVLAWSSRECIDRLALHASAEGQPLYESIGFVTTNEMRYALPVLHTS